MSNPTAGVPKRKNHFQGGQFGSQSPASSPQGGEAQAENTPRNETKPRGSTPQRKRGMTPPAAEREEEVEVSVPAQRSTSSGSAHHHSKALSAKKVPAAQARSSSQERERIVADESDGCAHALNVIRRNLDDKGRPLIKICILLNEFSKKKTGRTNEHCDQMLSAILESLADGRKVDGKDTAGHIDNIAEKLQEKFGDEFSNERMEAYRAALADAIIVAARDHDGLLVPWGRDQEAADPAKNFTRDWRKKPENRTYFSAAELADKIIGGVTKTKVADAFMVTRKVRNMQQVTDAIRRMREKVGATKPIFKQLAGYLLTHERAEITENNANAFLSAMTKDYFVRGTNAETGKMQSSFYIPKSVPFMAGAGNVTWHKKEGGKDVGDAIHFEQDGDKWVVRLEHRRHLLDLVFPKEANAKPASPAGAAIGLLAEMVKADEKTA